MTRKKRPSQHFYHGCDFEVDNGKSVILKESCSFNPDFPTFATTSQIFDVFERLLRHLPNCSYHLGIPEYSTNLSTGHTVLRCTSDECPKYKNRKSIPHSDNITIVSGTSSITCKRLEAQVIFSFMSYGVLLERMRKAFENIQISFGDTKMYSIATTLSIAIEEFAEDLLNKLAENFTEGKHDLDIDARYVLN